VLTTQNTDEIQENSVIIARQELNNDVIIANSISPVQDDKIVGSIVNITEQPYVIDELTTLDIQWEPCQDNVRIVTSDADETRLRRLKQLIKTDHLNNEESNSILTLANDYGDLFLLDGEYITATDIVTHQFNTPRCTKPINIRPYRLSWAYPEEIEKQVGETKRNNIIWASTSSFNFPLVVVKKKNVD
jgi:hypothetical protein